MEITNDIIVDLSANLQMIYMYGSDTSWNNHMQFIFVLRKRDFCSNFWEAWT